MRKKITLNFITVEKMGFTLYINLYLSSAILRGAARSFKYFNFDIILDVTGAGHKKKKIRAKTKLIKWFVLMC